MTIRALYPPRSETNSWPNQFYDNYGKNVKILLCPTDVATFSKPATVGGISSSNNVADASPRSYIINGWNDYFADQLGSTRLGDVGAVHVHSRNRLETKCHRASVPDGGAGGKTAHRRRFLHGFAGKRRQRLSPASSSKAATTTMAVPAARPRAPAAPADPITPWRTAARGLSNFPRRWIR